MARKRKLQGLNDFKRSIKNGYGIGVGENYKPWLRVQDVSSHGNSAKVWGVKTSREHHFFSEIETSLFYLIEFCDSVVDVREQFPLIPLSLSKRLAELMGIEHPKVPASGEPNIMTTDFLITRISSGRKFYEAVTVKPIESLRNKRTCEKLDLERAWWSVLGVKFSIFVGSELSYIRSKNIEWATHPIRYGFDLNGLDFERIENCIDIGVVPLDQLCNTVCSSVGVSGEIALYIVRYLIGAKKLIIDLDVSIQDTGLIEILSLDFHSLEGRDYGAA